MGARRFSFGCGKSITYFAIPQKISFIFCVRNPRMLVFANSGVIYRSVSAETYTLKVMGTRISLIYRMAWVINRLNGLNVLRAL